jgi:competence ComEA-like helix-hairpin-helix protein
MYKPGYRTSEFWFTLVSFIISGAFLFGIIKDQGTKDELIGVVTHAVESIILIIGQFGIFYKYLSNRNKYKREYNKEQQEEYDTIGRELEDYVGVDTYSQKININKASLGKLIQLPHIGPKLAKKILDYRTENGFYQNIADLRLVNGIGEQTYKDIEQYITSGEYNDDE